MNEIELYNALSEWAKEKDPTPILGARPTFLVICAAEDGDRVGILMGHVDPLIPKKVHRPPINQTLAQNVLLLFKEDCNDLLKECVENAAQFNDLVKNLGKETARTIFQESLNADDFVARVRAANELKA